MQKMIRKRAQNDNHLHRVRPLMEMIQLNCKAIYHPRQHLAVDERMVGTKARLSIKQYMKAKPTKWGLKLFVLAATNGYTIDFKLYTGKSKTASRKGLSFDVVAGLINKGNLGSGYIVYRQLLHQSPPLPTPETAGIWSLWDIQVMCNLLLVMCIIYMMDQVQRIHFVSMYAITIK